MDSQISKSIAMFFVAFITVGWILSEDVNYSSNITIEPEQTVVETVTRTHSDFIIKPQHPVEVVLSEKKGSLNRNASAEIIEHFIEPEVEEEIYYEPSMEELLDMELDILPDGMMDYLYDNGWEIELTDMDLAEEFDYPMRICGLTLYDEKLIYISDLDTYYIRRVTLHEVGHAFAYQAGKVDLTKDFIKIYEKEKDNFIDCTSIGDGHETINSQEYFASVFQNIYLNYEETYTSVPETVNYIESIIYNII